MIETLASAHGQSKRVIEQQYTVKDYYELVVKLSIDAPPEK